MKVSVGMGGTYLCALLDLVMDPMGMGSAPCEREGEGEPLFLLLMFSEGLGGLG